MSSLLIQIQSSTLLKFISKMFVELAENEMDERDCHIIHSNKKSCPLRKWIPTNPK